VNRRDLIKSFQEELDIDRRKAEEWLEHFVKVMTDALSRGEAVMIPGFTKWARVDRKARIGRNPQTGEPVKIAASRRVRITPLKAFKEAVNSGKGAAKKVVKKAPAKKAPAKKTAAKKAPAKKTAAKKAPAKKAPAKKTAAKKAPARKPAAKKAPAKKTAKKATKRR